MGYNLFSFGINTEKIKAVFGSRNQDILESIKDTDTCINYDDNDFGSGISVETALEQIFNGDSYFEEAGFVYGYALIAICAKLGFTLPYTQEINLGYETDFINKYLTESFDIKDLVIEEILLSQDTNTFKIPEIKDWPLIGLLYRSDLITLKEKLSSIVISDQEIEDLQNGDNEIDEEKGFAYQHIKGIIENIDYCITNDLDLITFCH